MSINPKHIDQLAAIIREVDGLRMIASAAERAEAILSHPGWPWQPPAALTQPEVGEVGEQEIDGFIHQWWEAFGKGYLPNSSDKALVTAALARWARLAAPPAPEVIEAVGNCARIELVVALHTLASQFENETAAFTGDDLRAVQGHVKHARKIAAKHNQNGPGCAPPALPANYIDPEHQGEALELLQTFYQACSAEGGTADEIHLRGLRAVLAARPPTPPAREVGEVGLLVDRLNQVAGDFDFLCNKIVNGECRTLACLRRGGYDGELSRARGIKPPDPLVATCPALEKAGAMRRAATLLQQQQHLLGLAGAELDRMMEQQAAPAPAAVPVAVSERLPDSRPESGGGDCDAEGRCWVLMPRSATPNPNWTLLWMGHLGPCYSHWLPASAIPAPSNYIRDKKSRLLPHAGEVEA
jgi:hypothetical protein